jgi:hypothetical protein
MKMKKKRKKDTRESPWNFSQDLKNFDGFFLIIKVCKFFFLQKETCWASFGVERSLIQKKWRVVQKKPIKLLSTLKETWWVFFLQSQIHMEKSHNTKKRWWRQKCLIMIVRKNPLSFSAERSSMGLFYVPNVCMLKQTRQTSFNVERSLGLREVWQEENEGL